MPHCSAKPVYPYCLESFAMRQAKPRLQKSTKTGCVQLDSRQVALGKDEEERTALLHAVGRLLIAVA